MTKKQWSEEEISYVKENYVKLTKEQIAVNLGRSFKSISNICQRHGFKLPENEQSADSRLTVLETYIKERYGKNCTYAKCICSCGKEVCLPLHLVKNNHTKSCGCLNKEKASERCSKLKAKDNRCKERLHRIWRGMIKRCRYKSIKEYKNYAGRDIKVCEDWLDYTKFKEWALSNGYQENLSIDRKENDLGYCPDNCRWSDRVEQQNNKRNNRVITAWGENKTVAQWIKDDRNKCNTYSMLLLRLNKGWNPELAISTPSLKDLVKEAKLG